MMHCVYEDGYLRLHPTEKMTKTELDKTIPQKQQKIER